LEKKIKFAVTGFGHIGRRHAEEISNHPFALLSAIIDTGETARHKAVSSFGVPVFASLDDFFASDAAKQVDIISICTPNGLHIPQARQVLQNKIHTLVEKPIGLKCADCNELIQLSKTQNKQVFCVLQNRYSPPSVLLKELIDTNKLGKIFWVEVNCYWNRDVRYYTKGSWRGTADLDGGTLFTQFSHFIDLLYWVFGPLKNIDGFFANFNHQEILAFEDTGAFHFEFEKSGAGIFSYSTALWKQNMESTITVIGEKGTVKVGGQYMEKLDYFCVENMERPELSASNPPNNYGNYTGSANNHALVIDNVIKALTGQPYQIASIEEAAASVNIIEEVYKIRDKKYAFTPE
jgi:UDP-N-acetyl-2-amino-2-deoxyglucuronate dehydrogenase